jgi:hypothetical protein
MAGGPGDVPKAAELPRTMRTDLYADLTMTRSGRPPTVVPALLGASDPRASR